MNANLHLNQKPQTPQPQHHPLVGFEKNSTSHLLQLNTIELALHTKNLQNVGHESPIESVRDFSSNIHLHYPYYLKSTLVVLCHNT